MDNEFVDRAQLEEQEAARKEEEKKKAAKKSKRAAKGKATKRTGTNAFVQILNGDFLTKE